MNDERRVRRLFPKMRKFLGFFNLLRAEQNFGTVNLFSLQKGWNYFPSKLLMYSNEMFIYFSRQIFQK